MIQHDLYSIVIAASQQIEVGNAGFASVLCDAGLKIDPENSSMLAIKGFADFLTGNHSAAGILISRAIEKQPQSAVAFFYAGEFNRLNNRLEHACIFYSAAARLMPFYDPPLHKLFEIRFTDPDYFYYLSKIHEIVCPEAYLEIGIMTGDSFKLASQSKNIIGIDPNPGKDVQSIHSQGKIFRMTSDDFFSNVDVDSLLSGGRLDLAFIDGMHLFEYVLRDFANVERYCHEPSVILLHDCLPIDEVVTFRDRRTGFWTGDTWKIVPCLRKYRPDLKIHTIETPPSGLTIISNLNPYGFEKNCDLELMISEFMEAPFNNDDQYLKEVFGLLPNSDESISIALSGYTKKTHRPRLSVNG